MLWPWRRRSPSISEELTERQGHGRRRYSWLPSLSGAGVVPRAGMDSVSCSTGSDQGGQVMAMVDILCAGSGVWIQFCSTRI
jgi:hypothetical protein